MRASDAVLNPDSLRQWAMTMYDLNIPLKHASQFVAQYKRISAKRRLTEYNLRLSLKWQLIPLSAGVPFPRPTAKPNRVNYPLDNYARQTRVTMASLLSGGDEAGPWQANAIRHMEDAGGHIGETHAILELESGNGSWLR